MISSKFYSQIFTCKGCNGWGFKNFPPKKDLKTCPECGGGGVFVSQSNDVYIWDAPTFIDYKGRAKLIIFRIIGIVGLILTAIAFFIVGKNLIMQLISFIK